MRQSHDRVGADQSMDESYEHGHHGHSESHGTGEHGQAFGDEFDHLSTAGVVEIGQIGRKDDLAGGTDESG